MAIKSKETFLTTATMVTIKMMMNGLVEWWTSKSANVTLFSSGIIGTVSRHRKPYNAVRRILACVKLKFWLHYNLVRTFAEIMIINSFPFIFKKKVLQSQMLDYDRLFTPLLDFPHYENWCTVSKTRASNLRHLLE